MVLIAAGDCTGTGVRRILTGIDTCGEFLVLGASSAAVAVPVYATRDTCRSARTADAIQAADAGAGTGGLCGESVELSQCLCLGIVVPTGPALLGAAEEGVGNVGCEVSG